MLNSDRCDSHPKAKSATRDYIEQMCHKSDPMEIDDIEWHSDEGHET